MMPQYLANDVDFSASCQPPRSGDESASFRASGEALTLFGSEADFELKTHPAYRLAHTIENQDPMAVDALQQLAGPGERSVLARVFLCPDRLCHPLLAGR
jgi:hypothetical protein